MVDCNVPTKTSQRLEFILGILWFPVEQITKPK